MKWNRLITSCASLDEQKKTILNTWTDETGQLPLIIKVMQLTLVGHPCLPQVQRSAEDSSVLIATYEGEHNHDPPTTGNESLPCFVSLSSSDSAVALDLRPRGFRSEVECVEFQRILAEKMASSLTQDPSFAEALASAISGRMFQHLQAQSWPEVIFLGQEKSLPVTSWNKSRIEEYRIGVSKLSADLIKSMFLRGNWVNYRNNNKKKHNEVIQSCSDDCKSYQYDR